MPATLPSFWVTSGSSCIVVCLRWSQGDSAINVMLLLLVGYPLIWIVRAVSGKLPRIPVISSE